VLWYILAILAIQEVEIARTVVQDSLGKKFMRLPSHSVKAEHGGMYLSSE
jgi:hypothetical protein